jgi:signal transduction histidine kinase/ActR/RegA family two-component response regulator
MQPSPSLQRGAGDFTGEAFLQLGAQQNRRVLWGVLFASAMLAAVAMPSMGAALPLAWLALVLAAQILRLRTEAAVADSASGPLHVRLRRRIAIAGLCGAAQALALAAFPGLDVAERAFFTVVLLGLATGAVANSAGHMRTVIAYGAPMLLPLVVLWATIGMPAGSRWLGFAMGLLIVFYGAVLHGFAGSAWQIFEESCHIRFKEAELNERLTSALAAAEGANRAKTRFLAAASHDLRQPLHTIVLLTSALGLRPLDPRSLQIVGLLNEVTETLSAQLDDLLDISKLDAGVVEVQSQTVPVQQLLAQHFSEVESVIQAKHLTARLDNAASAWVRVDVQLFSRVLRNLTQNAVKFTEQGEILLRSRLEGDEVVITVQDTGCGISPEHQSDVFQEFFQAGNPERDRSRGLGLGLSIVDRLCRLLGIAVSLRSEPGKGTCFELRLPRAVAPAPVAGGLPLPHVPRSYGLHVLIVDDERSVRTCMRLLLEELGCSCSEASSTIQACDLVRLQHPDLVLADFRLRGEDSGLKVLSAIDALVQGVTGVLVSGDTAPERLREARQAGRRLLHKPLSLGDLRQELDTALNGRRSKQEGIRDGTNAGAAVGAK